jgi:uncharacterized membrane protein
MAYQTSLTILAPLDRVWSELVDVERWPQSTTSMTSVERLDRGPFGKGSSARIVQPKLPTMVWKVTDFQPRREFSWSTSSPGVTTIAGHRLDAVSDTSVTVTLSIQRTGPLAAVVDLLFGGITRDYVNREITGLKRVCEAGSVAATA